MNDVNSNVNTSSTINYNDYGYSYPCAHRLPCGMCMIMRTACLKDPSTKITYDITTSNDYKTDITCEAKGTNSYEH